MSLTIPAIEMLLHAIIAGLQREEVGTPVFRASEKMNAKKQHWRTASFWVTISRVGLPIAYAVVALTILMPGIINVLALEYY